MDSVRVMQGVFTTVSIRNLASLGEDQLSVPAPSCQREGTQSAALSLLLAIDGRRGCLIPWQADR